MSPSADRNLLFGILALQMDFISREQLISAMHAWVLDKGKPARPDPSRAQEWVQKNPAMSCNLSAHLGGLQVGAHTHAHAGHQRVD